MSEERAVLVRRTLRYKAKGKCVRVRPGRYREKTTPSGLVELSADDGNHAIKRDDYVQFLARGHVVEDTGSA